MNTKQILIGMRELLSEPGHWTQGSFAKDAEGHDVYSIHENAVCWCLAGALTKVSLHNYYEAPAARVLQKYVGQSLTGWNDQPHRKHSEVLSVLDQAIADKGE